MGIGCLRNKYRKNYRGFPESGGYFLTGRCRPAAVKQNNDLTFSGRCLFFAPPAGRAFPLVVGLTT
ncbi:hypothetical protein, partial [Alistipes sp.]|uniref:hypothetical protein n=1 Tax=Alistipes sp. TaxID=1872444 RepID=UPI003AB3939A